MRKADDLVSRKNAINHARQLLDECISERHNQYSFSTAQRQLHNISEETFGMAKKIKEANGKATKKADFKGFANVELSSEEKLEAREWMRDVESVQVELDEFFASLYKIGIMKSEQTGGYQATAFCQDVESPNAGYILSAYAPSWYDALCLLVYKHAIHCEFVWPIGEVGRDVWG